jgi:phytoene dehydrogenase-like protein
MSDPSVIIIGAGLAGLSAGCFAQMNGYQSHIFEHHSRPGGVAASWHRGAYLIDGGIHFLMGHRPGTGLYDLYSQLGIVPANRFVDMSNLGRFIHEPSGRSWDVTPDLDCFRELKARSPQDAPVIDELLSGTRAMQGLDLSEVGLGSPPELASSLQQLKELWTMRRLLRYMTGKFGKPVAEYVRDIDDPVLGKFLEYLFLPEAPVYFILMILALLADGELAYLEGGCLGFVRAIEQHYVKLGGEVTYGARVDEILVDTGRAVGVRLAPDAPPPRERHAGAVISAADGHSTIFDMLHGQYVNSHIQKRYATWPLFKPLLMMSYGVELDLSGEPPFCVLVLREPLKVGGRDVEVVFVRILNYSSRFSPAGKTVVQVEFETEWDYWNELQKRDRKAYETEKARLAGDVLERLDALYPGLASRVEVTDVATPYTTWRYTLNHRASPEGWLMTPVALRTTIERTLPGLERLYLAGQWVMPGGGVPPVLYSGRHAVQILCDRDGKGFVSSPAEMSRSA